LSSLVADMLLVTRSRMELEHVLSDTSTHRVELG